jgi:hypothetical protein
VRDHAAPAIRSTTSMRSLTSAPTARSV